MTPWSQNNSFEFTVCSFAELSIDESLSLLDEKMQKIQKKERKKLVSLTLFVNVMQKQENVPIYKILRKNVIIYCKAPSRIFIKIICDHLYELVITL